MHPRTYIAVAAIVYLGARTLCSQRPPEPAKTQKIALSVGLSEFRNNPTLSPNPYADRDAVHFGDHLKSERGGSLAETGLQVLVNHQANQTTLRDQIQKALSQIRKGGEVYIFISGRGKSVLNYKEGYIYASDSVEEKGSSAIRVSELKDWMANSPASRIFLFADVARPFDAAGSPALPAPENLINERLQELGKIKISGKSIEGILAPGNGPPASGAAASKLNNFSYYLFEELQHPAKVPNETGLVDVNRLTVFLRSSLGPKTVTFGTDKAVGTFILSDLTKKPAPELRAGFPHWKASFAFLGGPFSGLGEQTDLDPFEVALREGRLIGPGSASELSASFNAADERLNRLALALENGGQQVITRYGTGDQFPVSEERKDLLEEKKADFVHAGVLFQAAGAIRTRMGAGTKTTDALKSKASFCAGRASLFDSDLNGARALLQQSDITEARNALGIVALRQGNYIEAEGMFRQAISDEPNWAFPRHNLALTLEEMGDYRGAESQYREAIARTPYYPYLYYNLALLLHKLNRKADAKKEYIRSFASFKEQEKRYLAAAAHVSELGDSKERTKLLGREKELEANEAEVHNALGLLNRSLDEFAQALQQNPKLLAAHHNRAALLFALGREKEAIDEWTANDFAPSHRQLGTIYLKRGDYTAAAKQLQIVVDANEKSAEARIQLARALAPSDPGKALTNLTELSLEKSERPDVHKLIGDIYTGLGRADQGCAEYLKASKELKESVFTGDGKELADLKKKSGACEGRTK